MKNTNNSDLCSENIKIELPLDQMPEGMNLAMLPSIFNNLNADKWAYIVHDKDESAAPHVHAFLHFENPLSENAVASALGINSNYMQIWNGYAESGFLYLIYLTDITKLEYSYHVEDVVANFDYAALVEKHKNKDMELPKAVSLMEETEEKKEPSNIRNVMIVQQLEYLPDELKPENIENSMKALGKIRKWAYIIHDKDPGEAPHLHLFIQFKNVRVLKEIAKKLGLENKPQYIQKWEGYPETGFAYLIHATDGAKNKYQYSAEEVTANSGFDYKTAMQKISKSVEIAKYKNSLDGKLKEALNDIASGVKSLQEIKDQMNGSEYAAAKKRLDTVHGLFLERNASNFHKKMEAEGTTVKVYWFYGDTGTGKTRAATLLASKSGNYYKSTTIKDPFQGYDGQHVIILDEFRPEALPYSELLAIFDPYSGGDITVSSRYFNKHLACHTFYITTPYDPREFYNGMKVDEVDHFDQLNRRLTEIYCFNSDYISLMEYDAFKDEFETVQKTKNPFSGNSEATKHSASVIDMINENKKSEDEESGNNN